MDKRFQHSGVHDDFSDYDRPYKDYIAHMQSIIERTRVDLNADNRDTIIAANSPKEHLPADLPAQKGILLVHGLLDSPHLFESLFQRFVQQGYLVRTLLLPGHGTVPGDLLETQLESWIDCLRYGIRECLKDCESLYLGGFSTGAALAIHEAAKGADLAGLILFAPPIEIRNPLAFVTNWHHAISWLIERAKWFYIGEDSDYAKYQSIAFNGVYQVYRLSQQLNDACPVPMFMVLSDEDEAINWQRAKRYFEDQSHPNSHCWVYSNDAALTLDDARVIKRSASYPDLGIVDFSHICLPMASDHPHYGVDGDYKEFQHYQAFWGKIFKKPEQPHRQGAMSYQNLKHYNLQRLTYNPDFENLVSALIDFIEKN